MSGPPAIPHKWKNTATGMSTDGSVVISGALLKTMTATAANNFAIGQVGYLAAAGTVTKAQADSEVNSKGMLFMATAAINATSGAFAQQGFVTVTAHGFTVGAPLFISAATAGALTTTAPAVAGQIVRAVGYASDANTIYFYPSPVWVVLT